VKVTGKLVSHEISRPLVFYVENCLGTNCIERFMKLCLGIRSHRPENTRGVSLGGYFGNRLRPCPRNTPYDTVPTNENLARAVNHDASEYLAIDSSNEFRGKQNSKVFFRKIPKKATETKLRYI